jgi:hypothetical protein
LESDPPDIAVIMSETLPDAMVADLLPQLEAPGLSLEVGRVEPAGPQATLLWLAPTALIIFVAKSYFDGFLKEAGKDHYQRLVATLGELRRRANTVPVTVVGTPGKAPADQPYSLLFAIYFDGGERRVFKFLVPNDGDEAAAEAAMAAFAVFLEAYYEDTLPAHHPGGLQSGHRADRADPPGDAGLPESRNTLKAPPVEPAGPVGRSVGLGLSLGLLLRLRAVPDQVVALVAVEQLGENLPVQTGTVELH